MTHLRLGRWDEAAEVAGAVLQRPGVSVTTRITALSAAGTLLTRLGNPQAQALLDEALELSREISSLHRVALVRAARAENAWQTGDPERAAEEARLAYDLAVSKRHPWFSAELAFWRWRAGEQVSLPEWAQHTPFARQIAGDWRAAAAGWGRLRCPYEQARALADGDAAAQFSALAIFERLGARPAAGELRQKLRAAGVTHIPRGPRPATRENPFGLTNRQTDILHLLAEGLTNAEIATRLHLSPKTVDHHVSAVLARLNVHSREAAAALLRQTSG
jgi:DNA-binding CsgD family transcriptional regulator